MTVPGGGATDPRNGDTTISFHRTDQVPDQPDEAPVRRRPDDEEAATIAALPQGSALLVMQRGGAGVERILLDADRVSAGRSEQADIFLDDVTVSRKHAEFVRDGARYTVRDTGSLNGTYVNRARVDAAPLVTGDEVQIGKFRLTYYESRAAASGAGGEA